MWRVRCVFFMQACVSPAEVKPTASTYKIEGDILAIPVPGFIQTCVPPTIWVNEAGGKRQASTWLPPKGGFYLDGDFVERSMGCDVRACQEAKTQHISLVEYQKVGERTSPEGYQLAEYKMLSLRGSLTVELPYFTDHECKNAQVFSAAVSR
jgi:hypothetical protein